MYVIKYTPNNFSMRWRDSEIVFLYTSVKCLVYLKALLPLERTAHVGKREAVSLHWGGGVIAVEDPPGDWGPRGGGRLTGAGEDQTSTAIVQAWGQGSGSGGKRGKKFNGIWRTRRVCEERRASGQWAERRALRSQCSAHESAEIPPARQGGWWGKWTTFKSWTQLLKTSAELL